MPREIAQGLVLVARHSYNETDFLWMEDAQMGILAAELGIGFADLGPEQVLATPAVLGRRCDSKSVIVHYVTEEEMALMYKNAKNGVDICRGMQLRAGERLRKPAAVAQR